MVQNEVPGLIKKTYLCLFIFPPCLKTNKMFRTISSPNKHKCLFSHSYQQWLIPNISNFKDKTRCLSYMSQGADLTKRGRMWVAPWLPEAALSTLEGAVLPSQSRSCCPEAQGGRAKCSTIQNSSKGHLYWVSCTPFCLGKEAEQKNITVKNVTKCICDY